MKHPKRTLKPRKPQEPLTLADEHIDPELACLLVAARLERDGRPDEAAVLKLELGEMLIRAALHKSLHPGPVKLASDMTRALGVFGLAPRVLSRVRARSPKKGAP